MNNTQIRLSILSFAALALSALLVFDYLNIRAESREIARLESLSGETEQREAAARALRALQTSAGGEIEAFENLTLSNESLVPFIESIEEMGRALDLDIKIASVEKKDEGEGGTQRIRMVIQAEGGWRGIFTLLKAVESLPYRVMIENVSQTQSDFAWSETITLSLHSFN